MINIFLKIHKAKFDRIGTIASIISGLAQHHENFGIRFVDLLLEDMRTALEERKYVYYQRLLLHTKLLGDLYNYSLIEHTMIFDRLYGLIDSNNGEIPVPQNLVENPGEDESKKKERETKMVNDEQYDLFRIRLVCTLLDTCGHYFKKGTHKDRLDLFLAHFQVYINAKIFWSRDIQFNIDDIFEELRPKAVRYYTYESALAALKEAESKKNPKAIWGYKSYKINSISATALIEEAEEEGDKDGKDLDNEDDNNNEGSAIVERRGGDEDDDEMQGDQYDDQAQDNVDTTPKSLEYIACKEDDAFLKELNAMMNDESSSSRSNDSRGSGLISIPMNLIKNQTNNPSNQQPKVISNVNDDNTINFKMLVKKGNKQKVLNFPVPVDNKMASQHLKEREIQKEQKNELKKLTLQLDQRDRQQDEDRSSEQLSFGAQPYLKSDRGQSNAFYSKDRNGFQGYPSFDDTDEDGNSPYGNLATRTATARGRGQAICNNFGQRPYGNQTQGRGRK
jgi:regulator of nonsense transcripts 2